MVQFLVENANLLWVKLNLMIVGNRLFLVFATEPPAISDSKVKSFILPIPSLTEQTRIVIILDKFDALTNSISEGLPREIKLRQQQYEYYRDLLLSFPKSETTV